MSQSGSHLLRHDLSKLNGTRFVAVGIYFSEADGLSMRVHVFPLLVLLGVMPLSLQSGAEANVTTDARRSIQADYDRMDAAAARKDPHGVIAYNAPDYVSIGPKGFSGTAKQLRITQSFFRVSQSLQGHSTVRSIVVQGKTATVVVRRLQSFVLAVPDPQTGRHDQYLFDSLSRETWLQGRSGWLRTVSRRLTETVQKNGERLRKQGIG